MTGELEQIMVRGVRYRLVSISITTLAVVGAVLVANSPPVQTASTTLAPVVDRLNPRVLGGTDLHLRLGITLVAMLVSLGPLFKPQPRRILDTVFLTQKRVMLATLALTTIGYFDYTFRLPRSTLIVLTALLVVVLPPWFVFIRTTADANGERALVIGDDPTEIRRVLDAFDLPVLGYVSPPTPYYTDDIGRTADDTAIADGGLENLQLLGGLSRLEDIIVDYDVDTAVFAFSETDREEFFGALAKCHDNGVDVKIHRDKADSVLVEPKGGEEIVGIDLEPWDWQDRAVKRLFDVAFAAAGLSVLSPVIALIVGAIQLESPGPVLYSQQRTAEFGDTFSIYKFRSMVQQAEADTGARLSEEDQGGVDPRVTRFGRILRRTHLDEIPQLWSVLVGDMSVVGPRPERPELEGSIEQGVLQWRRRWFVRPGLTGLAQINGVTGHQPNTKLRYDVEYIRKQSFRFDVMIVLRQVWMVLIDVKDLLAKSAGR
jgi:lipopolysaccharide/colanic/teichoic acid biosynthesis glycosyltransferase